jgi:hypothetical protein
MTLSTCFSPDQDIKKYFEEALASKVKVEFMGQVGYFFNPLELDTSCQ